MQSKPSLTVSCAVLAATLLSAGCALVPPPMTEFSANPPPRPDAILGPQFELVKAGHWPSPDMGGTQFAQAKANHWLPHVRGFIDRFQQAHIIIALNNPAEVRYLLVGPNGVLSSEIIRSGVEPDAVDIASDRQGNLHALIGYEHLMKKDGTWAGNLRTPWKEANLEQLSPGRGFGLFRSDAPWVPQPEFVQGAPDLVWAFSVRGGEMNLSRRTEFADCSGEGCIPFPMFFQTTKLLVVPEESPSYKHWYAVGVEDNRNINVLTITTVKQNELSVWYREQHWPRAYIGKSRHAVINLDQPCPGQAPGEMLKLSNGTPVCPVKGVTLQEAFSPPAAFNDAYPGRAIDPQSGDILLLGRNMSIMQHDKAWSAPVTLPIRNSTLILAPAGKGRFHALAFGILRNSNNQVSDSHAPGNLAYTRQEYLQPIYYMAYSGTAWSAPVEFGAPENGFATPQYVGNVWRLGLTATLLSDEDGHALLIWETKEGVAACWVTMK